MNFGPQTSKIAPEYHIIVFCFKASHCTQDSASGINVPPHSECKWNDIRLLCSSGKILLKSIWSKNTNTSAIKYLKYTVAMQGCLPPGAKCWYCRPTNQISSAIRVFFKISDIRCEPTLRVLPSSLPSHFLPLPPSPSHFPIFHPFPSLP